MLSFMNKAEVALRIHNTIQALSAESGRGTDSMKATLLLSGMLVEVCFLFDNGEEALEGAFDKLGRMMGCSPAAGPLNRTSLPPATVMDFDSEHGRAMAREFFEDWLDCPYEFHDMLLFLIQQSFMRWEACGQPRAVSLRLFIEATYHAMAYELAAQELCDAVIEKKIGAEGWTLTDSIAALAGLAGRSLAWSHDGKDQCCWFHGADLPDFLDQTAYVMTQEAVRLGLESGTDWRFGLPANDVPANPPLALVKAVEPLCSGFFDAVKMRDPADQAVSCAKAAGRMVAVVAGGAQPQIEPAVVKPLAIAALTESYKGVCIEYAVVS